MSAPTTTTGASTDTTTASSSHTSTPSAPPTTSSSPPVSPPPTTSSSPTTSSTPPTTSSTPPSTIIATTSSATVPPTTLPTTTSLTRTAALTTTKPAVVTQTSTQFISSTSAVPSGSAANANSGGSKGFFSNTGAVAGVFSVAGLIVLAIVIALITNTIRRRRARKFDRELDAATLEAASAPKPVFLDDEDDDYGPGAARGGYGGAPGAADMGYGGQYSDASSHGTYGQPAMSAGSHGESYGMREMGGGQSMGGAMHAVGPGEIFDPYAVAAAGAAGAAGIGVARARSGRVAGDGGYAAALQEGGAPYAAFAVPTGPTTRPAPNNVDILEAAGMGAHVAGAGSLARGQSVSQPQQQGQYNSQYQPYPASQQQSQLHQRSPSGTDYASLDRNRSLASHEPMPAPYNGVDAYGQYPQQQQGGYAQYDQQPQYDQQYNGQQQQYGQQQYTAQGYPQQHNQYAAQNQQGHQQADRYSVGDDEDDAYGGYVAEESAGQTAAATSGKHPNPFGPEGVERERERDSSAEDEEPRRVLKVANE